MTPEDWQRAKPILAAALELDSAHRESFLKEACADLSLRDEIQSLIVAHEQAGTGALNSEALPSFPKSALNAHPELTSGTRLGDFQILSLLGVGGMGEVYRARDLRLERDVAIKVLPRFVSLDPERLRRFEQEAKAAAALNHPNILAVFQMGTYEGAPYLVSELLEGDTLREQVKRGPISAKKAIEYGAQIARGLAAAHEKGIVHRDLKPENLFVTRDGRIKILDFGLAKLLHPESETQLTKQFLETEPGAVLGTVGYMSPEQVRGQAADHRADIFAFGAILYEMLTGRRAFSKPTSAETMSAILNEEPPRISQIASNVPPALELAVHRCLEKNVDQRFQSASDLAFALEITSDSGGASIGVTAPAIPRTAWKWMAGAGVVLAVVLAMLLWHPWSSRALTEKDTIVLADFANSTGDPIFDDTLKDALGVALRQSPFLDIASDEKVTTTLRLMTKAADTRLTPQVAREVCQRSQSKAYVGGSIATLGSQYVIGLRAVNCANGNMLAQQQTRATSKEKILDALGSAVTKLRSELGESLASVQKSDMPLEQLTTPSLEALQAYTMGGKAQNESKGASASLSHFLRAIELDPNFAHAYSSAGVMYLGLGDSTRAKEYITKAYALRERASAYESLLMQADYYDYVLGDLDKALELYQQMTESNPRDIIPWSHMAVAYLNLGQPEKTLEVSKQLVRLQPESGFFYPWLVDDETRLGHFSEAHKTSDLAVSRGFDNFYLRLELYELAFVEGDSKGMAEQVAWFEGKSANVQYRFLSREAATEAYRGHAHAAQDFARRAAASAVQAGNLEAAASYHLDAAWRETAFGDVSGARKEAAAALDLTPQSEDVESRGAEVLARAGNATRAQTLAQDLAKRFPRHTIIHRYWLPRIEAQIALAAKKPAEAIEQLREAEPLEARSCNYSYERGEAYLAAGQGSAAAAAFQQILDHPGLVRNCPSGALAHLQLGRAYAMQGDTAKARGAYKEFLTLWQDADSDIPILKEAKAEYAKLQ
jgi:serine/threonine protein kinase/tetratricopeptide (TPR) repeat protein